jgi:hypothetical protein
MEADMPKITMDTKQWRYRDSRHKLVEIITVTRSNEKWPVLSRDGLGRFRSHRADGRYTHSGDDNEYDLIPVEPPQITDDNLDCWATEGGRRPVWWSPAYRDGNGNWVRTVCLPCEDDHSRFYTIRVPNDGQYGVGNHSKLFYTPPEPEEDAPEERDPAKKLGPWIPRCWGGKEWLCRSLDSLDAAHVDPHGYWRAFPRSLNADGRCDSQEAARAAADKWLTEHGYWWDEPELEEQETAGHDG